MNDGSKRDEWMPHCWEGCHFLAWLRLLAVHRADFHFRYLYVVIIATFVSFVHSVIWLLEQAFLSHRLRRLPVPTDPIFILGHWRSGTTLLHELLIRDPQHAAPNTYQCFEPNHFLLTEDFFTRATPFLMPSRRPMDDMPAGWGHPQEDEFALCMMGQPSPYTHIAFPNQKPVDLDYLDFQGVDERARSKWAQALAGFLRRVSSLHPGKRLVLKSPPHSARIPTLMAKFPNARFIYIVRNPYEVFPSTVRLWKALAKHHSLQVPNHKRVEDFVVEAGRRLYDAADRDRNLIPANRFVEVRFEDLVARPMSALKMIYETLELPGFAFVRPRFEEYFNDARFQPTNGRQFCPKSVETVNRHWGHIARRYGYASPTEEATPAVPAQRLRASNL